MTDEKLNRIHAMQISNFMKIKSASVEISSDNRIVQICGDNGAGKTSFINFLWWMLQNPGKRRWADIINKDADFVDGKIVFGDIVVERHQTKAGTTTVKIYNQKTNTMPMETPQEWLNARLGRSIDIKEFSDLDGQGQIEALLDVVGLRAKSQQILSDITDAKSEKSFLKKREKDVLAVVESTKCIETSYVNVSLVMSELTTLEVKQRARESQQKEIESIAQRVVIGNEEISDLKKQLQSAETLLAEILKMQLNEKLELDSMPDVTGEISEKKKALMTASETNERAAQYKRHIAERKTLEEIEGKLVQADETVKTKTDEYKNLLSTANFPVPEISFDVEKGVVFNGIALKQEKDSSRELLLCFTVACASIPENGIRIVRIPNGESIGPKMIKRFEEIAEKYDVRVLMEVRTDDTENGIILEDGAVVANSYK